MKTVHWWLTSILGLTMLLLLVSCAAYIPDKSTGQNMTVMQARKALVTLKGINGISDVRVTSNKLIVTQRGIDTVYILRDLPAVSYRDDWTLPPNNTIMIGDRPAFGGSLSANPRYIVNALYVLKQNAIKAKKDADEYDTRFSASLTEYRKMAASNAALPEEANRYKVQAEGAVRDKNFEDAADLYAKALKIIPWWPAGHFNRALVLGETGDYSEAKREMKFYLQLVPDAPNTRAAQEKIYDWERLDFK